MHNGGDSFPLANPGVLECIPGRDPLLRVQTEHRINQCLDTICSRRRNTNEWEKKRKEPSRYNQTVHQTVNIVRLPTFLIFLAFLKKIIVFKGDDDFAH